MKSLHGLEHITKSDGNVFLDIGFAPDEAECLLAECDMEIARARAAKQEHLNQHLNKRVANRSKNGEKPIDRPS
ncbi:MAG: hypothetical protein JWQ11_1286 [Rhizobacter sp.]|nr:hypothetical protein [Rhizobacter sp.]